MPLFNLTEVPSGASAPPPELVNVLPIPQPVNVGVTGLARMMFVGSASVMLTPVSEKLTSLFVIKMVSWLVCPAMMVFGANDLFNVGGVMAVTASVAVPNWMFDSPSALLIAPTGILLTRFPIVMEETSIQT